MRCGWRHSCGPSEYGPRQYGSAGQRLKVICSRVSKRCFVDIFRNPNWKCCRLRSRRSKSRIQVRRGANGQMTNDEGPAVVKSTMAGRKNDERMTNAELQ